VTGAGVAIAQPSALEVRLARDVQAASKGDREAYGRIVDGTRNLVSSISLAILRDLPLSEDVTQEAYLEAWRNLRRLRNPASFVPWLRQITRNRAQDLRRRRARQRVVDLDEEQQDARPSARAQLIAAEEEAALIAALDELVPSAREVITLFYREGQSIGQVAVLLGMSEAAVKKRLQRARDQLRQATLGRLGESLIKTAPTAALTAAVIGALTTGAPATASAAAVLGKLGGVKSAVSTALLGKLGGAAAGIFAGAVGGILGVLSGLRKERDRARDDVERRALRRFAIVNVAIVALGTVAMPLGHHLAPNGAGLALGFLLMWVPMTLNYSAWLPRIVAPREALERLEDPAAEARQRGERRLSWLGFVVGSVMGGGTVVAIILRIHHLI